MYQKKEIKVAMHLTYCKSDLEAYGIEEDDMEKLIKDLIQCDFKKKGDDIPIYFESMDILEQPDEWEEDR
jgi:hypothetical protein